MRSWLCKRMQYVLFNQLKKLQNYTRLPMCFIRWHLRAILIYSLIIYSLTKSVENCWIHFTSMVWLYRKEHLENIILKISLIWIISITWHWYTTYFQRRKNSWCLLKQHLRKKEFFSKQRKPRTCIWMPKEITYLS